jgi:hypothetical protein
MTNTFEADYREVADHQMRECEIDSLWEVNSIKILDCKPIDTLTCGNFYIINDKENGGFSLGHRLYPFLLNFKSLLLAVSCAEYLQHLMYLQQQVVDDPLLEHLVFLSEELYSFELTEECDKMDEIMKKQQENNIEP